MVSQNHVHIGMYQNVFFFVQFFICTSTLVATYPMKTQETIQSIVPTKPNVLYFVIDDLRNELGYTNSRKGLHTPNIDKLAKEGLIFDRAYCQQGVCSPSRNSFLSGRRPDTTKVWNFKNSFRQTLGNITSLPEAFKLNGWLTTGMGKVYHPGHPKKDDYPTSWSTDWPYFHGNEKGCKGFNDTVRGVGPWYACSAPDSNFLDGTIKDEAITRLHQLANRSEPFFLAVGYHKPHIPWHVPLRFLNQQIAVDKIDIAKHGTRTASQPNISFYRCNNMNGANFSVSPDAPIPKYAAQQYRRAYRAAVSWMDFLVGEVLNTLEELGLANETIVVLHGDHGWQLGERGNWCKQTNFDLVSRVPFVIKVPWITQSHGVRTNSMIELVDLFPTLLQLANLQGTLPDEKQLEGKSFVPVLEDPSRVGKNQTFTQYPRCKTKDNKEEPWKMPTDNPCTQVDAKGFSSMGYSIRSDSMRYTIWLHWDSTDKQPKWDKMVPNGEELYDHSNDDGMDTDAFENENLADDKKYANIKEQLKQALMNRMKKSSNI